MLFLVCLFDELLKKKLEQKAFVVSSVDAADVLLLRSFSAVHRHTLSLTQ